MPGCTPIHRFHRTSRRSQGVFILRSPLCIPDLVESWCLLSRRLRRQLCPRFSHTWFADRARILRLCFPLGLLFPSFMPITLPQLIFHFELSHGILPFAFLHLITSAQRFLDVHRLPLL